MTGPSSGRGGGSAGGRLRREAMRAAALRRTSRLSRASAEDGAGAAQRPSIFVSYSRSDIDTVRTLVTRLRERGAEVTWDQDFIAGTNFRLAIRDAIDRASSVIVVWSRSAAQSTFVCDEAERALNSDKLIATHVGGFDLKELPIGFGTVHAVPVEDETRLLHSLAGHGLRLASGT